MDSAPNNGLDPLLRPGWSYVLRADLDSITAEEWAVLDRQRAPFVAATQARQALAWLGTMAASPSFGYEINIYHHCLQTATRMLRAGLDEETVVVGLLHDCAFEAAPATHGLIAAAFLGPYCSEANGWMLAHHQIFQDFHCHHHPGAEPAAREPWRGHPHFAWTAAFVENFDQTTIGAAGETLPLAAFGPMVERFFARPPRPLALTLA